MCCAAVAGDVCAGHAGSGGGAPSVFCSEAYGVECFLETGDLTGGQTVEGLGQDLELVAERETKEQKNCNFFKLFACIYTHRPLTSCWCGLKESGHNESGYNNVKVLGDS